MENISYKHRYKAGDEFKFFLTSDWHLEHTNHNRRLLKKEMDKACNDDCRIYINGDVYDAIILDDKRYNISGDTIKQGAVLDHIVELGVDFMKPYVDYIDIIGVGNHEVTVLNKRGSDIIDRTINELNKHRSDKIEPIKHGGYERFITHYFEAINGGARVSFDIFENHGQGGTAEVSVGTIDLNRYQYIMADIIRISHKHRRIVIDLPPMKYVNPAGNIREKTRKGIITGSYLKNIREYNINETKYQTDYGEERMRVSQSQGGVYLTLEIRYDDGTPMIIPKVEIL